MFTIIKTKNYYHKVVFDAAYDTMSINVCKYKDWNNGSPDSDNLIVAVTGLSSNYTVNLSATAYRQDVYVFQVIGYIAGVPSTFNFMVYDLSDLFTCFPSLTETVFISSVDAGCAPCDTEQQDVVKKARQELNKLILLTGQLIAYIDPVSAKMFGVFDNTDTKAEYEQMVGDIMEKINEITARCGSCD